MPEGHTIHRIASDHQREFAGQELTVSSPQGRFAREAKRLSGRLLESVEAHGKHLCYCWQGKLILHVHLGLYGKFRRHPNPPPAPRGQVRLRVVGEQASFDLNGPNTCELITVPQWTAIQDRLGPDPLRDDADVSCAWRKVQRSRAAIGTLLLNQSVLAGVGNIYRSEVLFLEGVHPNRLGRNLSFAQFNQIWSRLVKLMKIGKRYNRIIITEPTDVGKSRSRMKRDERLLIYKKQRCGQCDAKVEAWTLGGRTAYACPKCQK